MTRVAKNILDSDHHSRQFSAFTFRELLIYKISLLKGGLLINFDEGVEMRLRLDILEVMRNDCAAISFFFFERFFDFVE